MTQAGILKGLELENVLVCADLFRDARFAPNEADVAPWPSLERLRITGGIEAPNGTWYWTGDPAAVPPVRVTTPDCADDLWCDGEEEPDSEDEEDRGHCCRTTPDPGTYNPLALAFADAVLRMPRLKTARLEIGKHSDDVMTSVLECAEAGQPLEWDMHIPDNTSSASSYGVLPSVLQARYINHNRIVQVAPDHIRNRKTISLKHITGLINCVISFVWKSSCTEVFLIHMDNICGPDVGLVGLEEHRGTRHR